MVVGKGRAWSLKEGCPRPDPQRERRLLRAQAGDLGAEMVHETGKTWSLHEDWPCQGRRVRGSLACISELILGEG